MSGKISIIILFLSAFINGCTVQEKDTNKTSSEMMPLNTEECLNNRICSDSSILSDFLRNLEHQYSYDDADYMEEYLQNLHSNKIDSCVIEYMFSDVEAIRFVLGKKGAYMGMMKTGYRENRVDNRFPVAALDIPIAETLLKRLEGVYIDHKFPKFNSNTGSHILEEPSCECSIINIKIYCAGNTITDDLFVSGLNLREDNTYDYTYNLARVIEILSCLTREYLWKCGETVGLLLKDKDFVYIKL